MEKKEYESESENERKVEARIKFCS